MRWRLSDGKEVCDVEVLQPASHVVCYLVILVPFTRYFTQIDALSGLARTLAAYKYRT